MINNICKFVIKIVYKIFIFGPANIVRSMPQYTEFKASGEGAVFGTIAQMTSAAGAFLFGMSSLIIAIQVWIIQYDAGKDAQLSRTNDLFVKFEQNKSANFNDYMHSGACIAYVTMVAAEAPEKFEKIAMKDEEASRLSQYFFQKGILTLTTKSDDARVALKECTAAGDQKGENPNSDKLAAEIDVSEAKRDVLFDRFYRRFVLTLNNFESILWAWHGESWYSRFALWDRNSESNDLIDGELRVQICTGPIARLFKDTPRAGQIKKRVFPAFPRLDEYVKERCAKHIELQSAHAASASGPMPSSDKRRSE